MLQLRPPGPPYESTPTQGALVKYGFSCTHAYDSPVLIHTGGAGEGSFGKIPTSHAHCVGVDSYGGPGGLSCSMKPTLLLCILEIRYRPFVGNRYAVWPKSAF